MAVWGDYSACHTALGEMQLRLTDGEVVCFILGVSSVGGDITLLEGIK